MTRQVPPPAEPSVPVVPPQTGEGMNFGDLNEAFRSLGNNALTAPMLKESGWGKILLAKLQAGSFISRAPLPNPARILLDHPDGLQERLSAKLGEQVLAQVTSQGLNITPEAAKRVGDTAAKALTDWIKARHDDIAKPGGKDRPLSPEEAKELGRQAGVAVHAALTADSKNLGIVGRNGAMGSLIGFFGIDPIDRISGVTAQGAVLPGHEMNLGGFAQALIVAANGDVAATGFDKETADDARDAKQRAASESSTMAGLKRWGLGLLSRMAEGMGALFALIAAAVMAVVDTWIRPNAQGFTANFNRPREGGTVPAPMLQIPINPYSYPIPITENTPSGLDAATRSQVADAALGARGAVAALDADGRPAAPPPVSLAAGGSPARN